MGKHVQYLNRNITVLIKVTGIVCTVIQVNTLVVHLTLMTTPAEDKRYNLHSAPVNFNVC